MFILARGLRGQATLMHITTIEDRNKTVCGRSVVGWSREYHDSPFFTILCRSCAHRRGIQIP